MSQEDKPVAHGKCYDCFIGAACVHTLPKPVAAQEPVAWRVWGINPNQRYILDTAYSQEDADDLADRLGEFWGGTDKLYANAAPCARCKELETQLKGCSQEYERVSGRFDGLQAKITEQAERIKALEAERDTAYRTASYHLEKQSQQAATIERQRKVIKLAKTALENSDWDFGAVAAALSEIAELEKGVV